MWCFRRDDRSPFHRIERMAGGTSGTGILEISTRGATATGRALSAMNLRLGRPDTDVTLEAAYQAAKDFGEGPAPVLERMNGFEAKRRAKSRAAEAAAKGLQLVGFSREGIHWPRESGTAFYDRLWLEAALKCHGSRLEGILAAYAGFSDCFHRPGAGMACQAAAAATASHLLTAMKERPDQELVEAIETAAGWARWRGVETEPMRAKTDRKCRVASKRTHRPEAGDVYIGRPGPWGNPFPLKDEKQRHEVIGQYREWLVDQIESGRITREALRSLAGSTLVCWCAPKACHGHVLTKAVEWACTTQTLEDAPWTNAEIASLLPGRPSSARAQAAVPMAAAGAGRTNGGRKSAPPLSHAESRRLMAGRRTRAAKGEKRWN